MAWAPRVERMEEPLVGEAEPDLGALERIEGELFAVERALERIDEGVYSGFEGLPEPA
jgi:hypothetical protein